MASSTDVTNAALRFIGGARITSLIDGSNNANVANDIYEEVRDDLLRSHPWNFATKRSTLAQSGTDPDFEFDNAFVLPADWLRNVSVHDNEAGHGTVLYRTEEVGGQRCIVTSADAIYLRYVYQVTDPNLMSPDFRRTLELALARDLAIPIASSNTLRADFEKRADRALARARSSDAMGSFPELRPRGSWANARGGFHRDDYLSD